MKGRSKFFVCLFVQGGEKTPTQMQRTGGSPETLPQLRQTASPDGHGHLLHSPLETEKEFFRTEVAGSGSRTKQFVK